LNDLRRRRAFSLECQLEMGYDLIDNLVIIYKRYDGHFASTGGAQQRVDFIHLADHVGPADELFPQKQGKDLVGEDFLDNLVMETTERLSPGERMISRAYCVSDLSWVSDCSSGLFFLHLRRRRSPRSTYKGPRYPAATAVKPMLVPWSNPTHDPKVLSLMR